MTNVVNPSKGKVGGSNCNLFATFSGTSISVEEKEAGNKFLSRGTPISDIAITPKALTPNAYSAVGSIPDLSKAYKMRIEKEAKIGATKAFSFLTCSAGVITSCLPPLLDKQGRKRLNSSDKRINKL